MSSTDFENVYKGRVEKAIYREALVRWHRGNPLVEALPPVLVGRDEINDSLINDVHLDDDLRNQPAEIRLHELDSLRQIWLPQPVHRILLGRISTMLRSGYMSRDPRDVARWHATLASAQENLRKLVDGERVPRTRAKGPAVVQAHSIGLTVAGLSGVGKTTSVKRILEYYPQVLLHEQDPTGRHKDIPVAAQIVWLLVTCPGDGGMVGLARAILRAFDAVLGTTYNQDFTDSRASAETMRGAAVSLAHVHALGMLVIDEIQVLRRSNKENAKSIMNFLLALMNDLGVPVVCIGTSGTAKFLGSQLQDGRRYSSGGYFPMAPLQKGPELEFFVEFLWTKSLLRELPPLAEFTDAQRKAILQSIWLMTAGIHDLVIKAFLLAQFRALEIGQETLTPDIFRDVQRHDFVMVEAFVRQHRNAKSTVDDLEWDAVRKAFFPAADGSTIASASNLEVVYASPISTTEKKASTSKPVKKKKPAAPHRREKPPEDQAAAEAELSNLAAEGVLGGVEVGEDGDVLGDNRR